MADRFFGRHRMRLIRWFNNLHLKNKLLICNGGLIVLSVLLGGIFSFYNMQKYIYEQAGDSFQQTLEQVTLNVEYKVNLYDELINRVVTDKKLIYALLKEYDSPADYTYEYLNTLGSIFQMKEKDKMIHNIFIYKDNPTLPQDGENLLELENIKSTWWFDKYFGEVSHFGINDFIRAARSKVWIITDEDLRPKYTTVKSKKLGRRIAIIKPVIFNYERLLGILEFDIHYDAIFGEYKANSASEGDFFLIANENHEIVFDSRMQVDGRTLLDSHLAGEIDGKTKGRFTTGSGKEKKLVLFSKGQYSGWVYFREVSIGQMLQSAQPVRLFTLLNALVSILISFLAGILIAKAVSKRIAHLADKMETFDDSTRDIEVQLDGYDEIGHLAQSYNRMLKKIRDLIGESEARQQLLKEAEIKALQAQINPHFLYNTLATINWMAMGNQTAKIMTMVNNLSTFYTLSLNKGEEYLTVEEEIHLTKAYSDIQKVRWEDKIDFHFEVSEEIRKYYTLKLILQPFVENAIIHGAEYKRNGKTNIVIRGCREEDYVVLEVIDDGTGMKCPPRAGNYAATSGYGIRNVHEKIQLRYGGTFGVEVFSKAGIGTRVRIVFPVIEMPDKKL